MNTEKKSVKKSTKVAKSSVDEKEVTSEVIASEVIATKVIATEETAINETTKENAVVSEESNEKVETEEENNNDESNIVFEDEKVDISNIITISENAVSALDSIIKFFDENIKKVEKSELKKLKKPLTSLVKTINKCNITITELAMDSLIAKPVTTKKPKVEKDTSKASINKPVEATPFFLEFIKAEEGLTTTSRAKVQQAINNYVKTHPEILHKYEVNGKIKNDSFRIEGELKVLFDNISKEMTSRGLSTDEINSKIKDVLKYTDILKVVSYCIKK
jgi:hypothetical protein